MKGMTRATSFLVDEFLRTPWAILPQTLAQMQAVVWRWAAGLSLSAEEIDEVIGEPRAQQDAKRAEGVGDIGLINVFGILSQRSGIDESSNPIQGVDPLRAQLREMAKDQRIGTIVLNIHSPGGSVFGIQEFWDDIFALRGQKKVVAVSNSVAASAAYYIASAADEIVVTPGGMVGSIGVLSAHEDWSKRLEELGVKVTLVSAGKYKVEGNMYEPLSDEARANMQSIIDSYYGAFVNAVAKGRGAKASDVSGGFGQGRMLTAADAKAERMVDRIETLDQVFARLASSKRAQSPRRRAEAETRISSVQQPLMT